MAPRPVAAAAALTRASHQRGTDGPHYTLTVAEIAFIWVVPETEIARVIAAHPENPFRLTLSPNPVEMSIEMSTAHFTAHPEVGRPPYLAALARSILSGPTADSSYPSDTTVRLAFYGTDQTLVLQGDWHGFLDTLKRRPRVCAT